MMNHPIYKVKSFEIVGNYTLLVTFDDGHRQQIDFRPVLAGELYGPLQDLHLFNQVSINPEVHTLEWPNGADFDPETLHDWPEHVEALKEESAKWELIGA
jgi:hypothetical protein